MPEKDDIGKSKWQKLSRSLAEAWRLSCRRWMKEGRVEGGVEDRRRKKEDVKSYKPRFENMKIP